MSRIDVMQVRRVAWVVVAAAIAVIIAGALNMGTRSTALAQTTNVRVAAASVVAEGKTFTQAGNRYKVIDANVGECDLPEVKLVKYGSSNKKPYINAVAHGGVKYEVEIVGSNAFNNAKGHAITHLTLGRNVDAVGAKAFYGCSKLKVIDLRKADIVDIDRGKKGYYLDGVDIGSQAFKKAGTSTVKVRCGFANASYRKIFKQALVKKGLRMAATVVK